MLGLRVGVLRRGRGGRSAPRFSPPFGVSRCSTFLQGTVNSREKEHLVCVSVLFRKQFAVEWSVCARASEETRVRFPRGANLFGLFSFI